MFEDLKPKSRLNSLCRWFSVSSRVAAQSAAYDVSIEMYVSKIEKYYENVELEKLSLQYDFQDIFAEKYGPMSLLGLDKEFLESVLDVPLCDLSAEEIFALESYGIDLQKFTSDDLSERLQYQSLILPENTRDYLQMVIDNDIWSDKKNRTKFKNDYLESHPELSNFKLLKP